MCRLRLLEGGQRVVGQGRRAVCTRQLPGRLVCVGACTAWQATLGGALLTLGGPLLISAPWLSPHPTCCQPAGFPFLPTLWCLIVAQLALVCELALLEGFGVSQGSCGVRDCVDKVDRYERGLVAALHMGEGS